jgi:hypothetical protein
MQNRVRQRIEESIEVKLISSASVVYLYSIVSSCRVAEDFLKTFSMF